MRRRERRPSTRRPPLSTRPTPCSGRSPTCARAGRSTFAQALRGGVSEPALVPFLIPLLARNDVFLDVLRALRTLAPAVTGQLVDTLLDPTANPVVRRRVPRVLKACATQRAADGLRLGLEDPRFDLRTQCALALSAITRKNPALVVPREAVFAVVLEELERGRRGLDRAGRRRAHARTISRRGDSGSRSTPRASVDRGIDHVFTLLSLTLPREPLADRPPGPSRNRSRRYAAPRSSTWRTSCPTTCAAPCGRTSGRARPPHARGRVRRWWTTCCDRWTACDQARGPASKGQAGLRDAVMRQRLGAPSARPPERVAPASSGS